MPPPKGFYRMRLGNHNNQFGSTRVWGSISVILSSSFHSDVQYVQCSWLSLVGTWYRGSPNCLLLLCVRFVFFYLEWIMLASNRQLLPVTARAPPHPHNWRQWAVALTALNRISRFCCFYVIDATNFSDKTPERIKFVCLDWHTWIQTGCLSTGKQPLKVFDHF